MTAAEERGGAEDKDDTGDAEMEGTLDEEDTRD